jgi:hypothetical protein
VVVVFAIAKLLELVPLAAPFKYHWYESGAVPVAATPKFAACPSVTVALAGCCEITGAVRDVADVFEPPLHAVRIIVKESITASANAAPPD